MTSLERVSTIRGNEKEKTIASEYNFSQNTDGRCGCLYECEGSKKNTRANIIQQKTTQTEKNYAIVAQPGTLTTACCCRQHQGKKTK